MKYTADLLAGAAAVLPLGDNQYEEGTLTQFRQSYDLSWGRYKSVTHPSVGNHEYLTTGASGYFDYFGAAAGARTEGWYSFNIGGWHLVALNSQCSKVGGCGVGSRQYQWLKADLAANSAACTLAYWHIPRFAHGQFSNSTAYQPFWQLLYDDGAEVVLVGHDHNYQRYAPQTPTGGLDYARGIRQFIVGTGGKNLVVPDSTGMNREAANGNTHGVLKLTLRPTAYDWRFTPEAGKTYTDSGTNSCH
jgi:calcineurin-like phosphoesterase family protein